MLRKIYLIFHEVTNNNKIEKIPNLKIKIKKRLKKIINISQIEYYISISLIYKTGYGEFGLYKAKEIYMQINFYIFRSYQNRTMSLSYILNIFKFLAILYH